MPGRYPEGPWPIGRACFPSADIIIWKVESPKCFLGDIDFSLGATLSIYNKHIEIKSKSAPTQLETSFFRLISTPSHQSVSFLFFVGGSLFPISLWEPSIETYVSAWYPPLKKQIPWCVSLCLAGAHVYSPDVEQNKWGLPKVVVPNNYWLSY